MKPMRTAAFQLGQENKTVHAGDVNTSAIWLDPPEERKKVRDILLAARPNWMSMDCGSEDEMATNDVPASVYWNGAMLRARLKNPNIVYGYPKEGDFALEERQERGGSLQVPRLHHGAGKTQR